MLLNSAFRMVKLRPRGERAPQRPPPGSASGLTPTYGHLPIGRRLLVVLIEVGLSTFRCCIIVMDRIYSLCLSRLG